MKTAKKGYGTGAAKKTPKTMKTKTARPPRRKSASSGRKAKTNRR